MCRAAHTDGVARLPTIRRRAQQHFWSGMKGPVGGLRISSFSIDIPVDGNAN